MKKCISLVLIIIALLTGCTSEVYKTGISEGDRAMTENRYGDALNSFQKALEEEPSDKKAQSKLNDAKQKYINKLNEMIVKITSQSANAETVIQSYSNVWKYSIQMTLDEDRFAGAMRINRSELSKYNITPEDSRYYAFKGNFNNALKKAYEYFDKSGKINELETDRNNISAEMKLLNNPSQEYKDVFNNVLELYNLYERYVTLALEPSGSLSTFNQQASQLSSDIVSKVKELEIKIPN